MELNIINRIKNILAWRREYQRVYAELASHTEREMNADLGLNRSDIAQLAADGANQRLRFGSHGHRFAHG